MKNFKRISYIILIVIIIILSLIIYFSVIKNNDNEQDKKGVSEIRYVESKLVDLINSMNNIDSRNYKIPLPGKYYLARTTSHKSFGRVFHAGKGRDLWCQHRKAAGTEE